MNRERSPRAIAPKVSPWYAPSKEITWRRSLPWLRHHCHAILRATSTAVEPLSEKNSRSRPVSALSRVASCSAGSWLKLAKITCSSCWAWRAIAAPMAGSAWPCRVTHQLLMASIKWRPSLSSSSLPRAARTCSGSGLLATWVVGCQRWGCQVTGSGFKVINEAHRKSPDSCVGPSF